MVCRTLARLDLIRVPLPAARTAAKVGASWRSNMGFYDSYPLRHRCPRIAPEHHGLGRQDSNLRSRDQNPVPCHLATPHRGRSHSRLKTVHNFRDYTEASVGYQQWAVSCQLFSYIAGRPSQHLYTPLDGLADDDTSFPQPIRRDSSLHLRNEDSKDRSTGPAHHSPQSARAQQLFLQCPYFGHQSLRHGLKLVPQSSGERSVIPRPQRLYYRGNGGIAIYWTFIVRPVDPGRLRTHGRFCDYQTVYRWRRKGTQSLADALPKRRAACEAERYVRADSQAYVPQLRFVQA